MGLMCNCLWIKSSNLFSICLKEKKIKIIRNKRNYQQPVFSQRDNNVGEKRCNIQRHFSRRPNNRVDVRSEIAHWYPLDWVFRHVFRDGTEFSEIRWNIINFERQPELQWSRCYCHIGWLKPHYSAYDIVKAFGNPKYVDYGVSERQYTFILCAYRV